MKALCWHGHGDVRVERVKLDDAPAAYKNFRDRKDGCIKVVLSP